MIIYLSNILIPTQEPVRLCLMCYLLLDGPFAPSFLPSFALIWCDWLCHNQYLWFSSNAAYSYHLLIIAVYTLPTVVMAATAIKIPLPTQQRNKIIPPVRYWRATTEEQNHTVARVCWYPNPGYKPIRYLLSNIHWTCVIESKSNLKVSLDYVAQPFNQYFAISYPQMHLYRWIL